MVPITHPAALAAVVAGFLDALGDRAGDVIDVTGM
jgi:hypothetical protein